MAHCLRCERTDKEVRLLDAIYENEIVKICDRCAIIESIPVIKKPSTSQLKESERVSTVYERLDRISGLRKEEEKHETILDKLRSLEEHPELEAPEEKRPFNLVENFHWHIARARRNRGLSQKQLGWAIAESETAIKMIEKAEIPEEPEKLIRKLEQFLQTKLRERTEEETREEERTRQIRLREASKIPEAETEYLEEEEKMEISQPIKPIIEEPELEQEDVMEIASGKSIRTEPQEKSKIIEPSRVLTFKPEALEGITVSDLKTLKDERERVERMEDLEEERKKALQADSIIRSVSGNGEAQRELKKKIAEEMKELALRKIKERESIEDKRKKLSKTISKLGKKEEEKKKEEKTPTIYELFEKKRQKEKDAIIGNEIEIDDFENIEEELKEEEIGEI